MTTSLKTCFKCLAEKKLEEFYRHPQMADGHLNKCKACARKDVIANCHKDIERTREKDRARYQRDKKRINPERTEYARKLRSLFPKAYKARNAVNNALKNKLLTKLPCFICGELKVHGHHPDYDRPLEVVWLCPVHHAETHALLDKEN